MIRSQNDMSNAKKPVITPEERDARGDLKDAIMEYFKLLEVQSPVCAMLAKSMIDRFPVPASSWVGYLAKAHSEAAQELQALGGSKKFMGLTTSARRSVVEGVKRDKAKALIDQYWGEV